MGAVVGDLAVPGLDEGVRQRLPVVVVDVRDRDRVVAVLGDDVRQRDRLDATRRRHPKQAGEVGEAEPRRVLAELDDVGALDDALVDRQRDAGPDRADEERDLVLVDELLRSGDAALTLALGVLLDDGQLAAVDADRVDDFERQFLPALVALAERRQRPGQGVHHPDLVGAAAPAVAARFGVRVLAAPVAAVATVTVATPVAAVVRRADTARQAREPREARRFEYSSSVERVF